MKSFEAQVALITGGASGIGLALGRELAARGAHVMLADIDSGRLAAAVADVPGAEGAVVDVADAAALERVARTAVERWGGLHLAFANAGLLGPTGERLWEVADDEWRRTLEINLFGIVNTLRACVPYLLQQDSSHVVITGSMASVTSESILPAYWASKHGAVAVAETLRAQFERDSVKTGVSVLLPGRVETSIHLTNEDVQSLEGDAARAGRLSMAAEEVARITLASLLAGDFYIVTHPEAVERVRQRVEPLLAAFERAGLGER